jgi:virginiamycin A acetyltransferase
MRFIVKRVFYGIALLLLSPFLLSEWAARALLGRDVFFATHTEILAFVPGTFGVLLRNAYYYATLAGCRLDSAFAFGTRFTHSRAVVGARIYMGFDCIIGQARIGDDTMLADRVSVLSGRHQHGTQRGDSSFQDQQQRLEWVHIGSNCWIGTGAIIMANVGDNVVIGAGSVVTKPIESDCVAVGNPCRVLRHQESSPPSPHAQTL